VRVIERSAGFVIFHVEPSTGAREYLLLDYGPYWDYPKGHVEKGEDDLTAARRELQEETGITQIEQVPGFQKEMTYFFRARGKMVRKTVVFFLASTETRIVTLSDEHQAAAFLPYANALAQLKYASSKELLRTAEAVLQAIDLLD
jgi:8-oxo-dGTP pyrophosphatase MutT (NUDIX family)